MKVRHSLDSTSLRVRMSLLSTLSGRLDYSQSSPKSQPSLVDVRVDSSNTPRDPGVQAGEVEGRTRSGRCVCRCPELRIPIAIGTLGHFAILVANALDDALRRLDIETAACPDGNTSNVGACLFARGDFGFHPIPGLEPLDAFLPGEIAARETGLIQPRALVAAAPRGLDRQGGLFSTTCNVAPVTRCSVWSTRAFASSAREGGVVDWLASCLSMRVYPLNCTE